MPQRASQQKFGKSLKLHLANQKKQKLEETWNRCRREKCIEKENVCFEEARRESIMENEKKSCWYVSGSLYKKHGQKQETRG